jgi:Concanavalin A-like lectin/glucanases superfamily/Domain of unknown function (DUF2341)
MTPVNISSASALVDYQVQVDPKLYNNTGLVGSWHFSEGAGTLATDSSGNGNTGTITIAATGAQTTVTQAWSNGASGKFGSSLSLDGTDDYVELSNPTTFDVFSSGASGKLFTFESWIKFNTVPTGSEYATFFSAYSSLYPAVFRYTGGQFVIWIYSGGWRTPVTATFAPQAGVWYHLAYVKNSPSEWGIYINGTNYAVGTNSYTSSVPSNIYVGTYAPGPGSGEFNGKLDEIRIYNRSLSPAEIQEQYNATKARLDYADLRFTQPYSVYETLIPISGTGSDLTDYQVMLNVTDPTILLHMRADGADLRLFSSATSTPYASSGLAYWIESINSTQVRVWVKANISAGGSTLYLYYGNTSAPSASNGTNTFIQYMGSSTAFLAPLIALPSDYAYEGLVRPAGSNRLLFSGVADSLTWSPANGILIGVYDIGNYNFIGNQKDGLGDFTNIAPAESTAIYYRYKITRTSSIVNSYVDNVLVDSAATYIPTANMGLALSNYRGSPDQQFSFIRKYSATEPSAAIGAETVKSSGNEAPLNYWLERLGEGAFNTSRHKRDICVLWQCVSGVCKQRHECFPIF